MGFLDNLEDSLKSLESREERDPNEAERRNNERGRSIAAAPWADKLRHSQYTKDLLDQSVVAGHRIRAKVYMAWIEGTLRLEARGRTLELVPTADGITGKYTNGSGETTEKAVDLNGNPQALLDEWLAGERAPEKAAALINDDSDSAEEGR